MTGCAPFGKSRAQSRNDLSKQLKCPVDFLERESWKAAPAPAGADIARLERARAATQARAGGAPLLTVNRVAAARRLDQAAHAPSERRRVMPRTGVAAAGLIISSDPAAARRFGAVS